MEKLLVEVGYCGNNYGAYIPVVDGVVATGASLNEVKQNMKDALEFHIEGSLEDNDPLPEVLKTEFVLDYHFSTEALLNHYSDIFTKAALSRITGINERQLWFYASGARNPRPKQRKRIEDGLHKLGEELLSISI